ncbi:hypothetical protein PPL_03030 [Heterostelium album PN500]|uniref:RNA polymerase II-associated protein 3 n=1 Tax=Heterostelium pallidum (strain ATCC 26659 / Pp 5 / PN500) TaxID=670386 RepID=D3B3R2_HETP5|nr:hypothetical protein PPL_03030 [Heterostelium album PN500]EFA83960.1 hypothetical protein PPL_03030 [Heterostelium album PN500]|eukprot:XP_020436077.1 hypothetical protein PPL_03030 [Heterostelium album PN500]
MTDKSNQNNLKSNVAKEYLKSLKVWQTNVDAVDQKIIESKRIKAASTPITNTSSSKIFDASAESLRYKDLGNDQFKVGHYKEAVEYYTLAIQLDNSNAILFANRAMSYLKLKNYSQVVADCNISINLDRTYIKAYHRRGQAYKELKKYKEALDDFNTVLKQDPKSNEAANEVVVIKKLLQQQTVAESIVSNEKKSNVATTPSASATSTSPSIETLPVKTTQPTTPTVTQPTTEPPVKTRARVVEIEDDDDHEMIVDTTKPKATTNTTVTTETTKPTTTITPIAAETTKPTTTNATTPKSSSNSLQERLARLANMKPTLPKTAPRNSFEFEKFYNSIQNDSNLFYNYFKLIEPEKLPNILNDILSPSLFSSIIVILENNYLVNKEYDLIYRILESLTKMNRLSINLQSLSFMEKESINILLKSLNDTIGKDKVDQLKSKFIF